MTRNTTLTMARAGHTLLSLFAALAVLLMMTFLARSAEAHQVGQSYLYLQVYEDRITGRFEIALQNLNPALGLEGTEQEITRQNWEDNADWLWDYYLEKVTLSANGKELPLTFTGPGYLGTKARYVMLHFDIGGYDEVPERLDVHYGVLFDEDPDHRGFLLIETNWATGTFANEKGIALVFSPDARDDSIDLISRDRWGGFVAVVGLGIEHIWEGIDHILFLIALLIPAVMRRDEKGKWQPIERFGPALLNVIKIVTAFTVAHSVTLSLAALGIINLPGTLVEVIIAASIAIAAADILYPIFRGRVWVVVFAFGLFHGFGFAGALADMGVFGEFVWMPLLAFNLGVELGQIVVVAVVFPLLFLVRKLVLYPRAFMPLGALMLILISFAWVAERSLDFTFREVARDIVRELRS
ncbi:MAG: HupE/UreJ family protein [Pseudomonadota bacterium]